MADMSTSLPTWPTSAVSTPSTPPASAPAPSASAQVGASAPNSYVDSYMPPTYLSNPPQQAAPVLPVVTPIPPVSAPMPTMPLGTQPPAPVFSASVPSSVSPSTVSPAPSPAFPVIPTTASQPMQSAPGWVDVPAAPRSTFPVQAPSSVPSLPAEDAPKLPSVSAPSWNTPSVSTIPSMPPSPSLSPVPEKPAVEEAPASATPSAAPASEKLEDQNIFFLLGVEDATEQEKESFLDELQQVIWEDFLERDVELLLTSDELTVFTTMKQKTEGTEEERQTEMITYLEKLIPDLEKIMLEKALELKEEMMRERIAQLKTQWAQDSTKLAEVDGANDLLSAQKWRSAAVKLNALPAA